MTRTTATVLDLVVRWPKTLGPATTVAQARTVLLNQHVHLLLITADDGRLLGTVDRDDLSDHLDPGRPALEVATLEGRTFAPDLPAETARQVLLSAGQRRRAVVDDEGRLLGLLCLKRRQTGFCTDADLAARAAERS